MASTALIQGQAWVFQDNIDTDQIFPGQYLAILDPKEMGNHAMEGVPEKPEFQTEFQKGDIVIAGENFGCGSSREHAPRALLSRGVSVVLAVSFAHIFYRNAINIGLPIMELEKNHGIQDKDILQVNLATGKIKNLTRQTKLRAFGLKGLELSIVEAKGLLSYIRSHRDLHE